MSAVAVRGPASAALLGMVVAGTALGAAEGALRFLDVRPGWSSLFHAFTRTRLLIPATVDGEPGFRTNPAYREYFHEIAVPADPAGTIRLVALGGSFVHGWDLPNPAAQAFPAVLGRLLTDTSGRAVEVINAGAPGWGSYRTGPLLEELLGLRPRAVIVINGHNEFWEFPLARDLSRPLSTARVIRALEPFRWYGLLGEGLTAANRRWVGLHLDWSGRFEPIDDAAFARIRADYRAHLEALAARCRAARVRLILGTQPVNLRCDPQTPQSSCRGASRHPRGLSPGDLAGFDAAVAAGRTAEAARRWGAALAAYARARRIDPGYAELRFREGRCLEGLGRWDEAREAYWAHLEGCRRLVVREFNAQVRRVGAERGVAVCDAERLFERASPHGIPGEDWFLDDAHLTPRGHRLLARALQKIVYMNGRVLEPATMSSAASSRIAVSGTIHQAR